MPATGNFLNNTVTKLELLCGPNQLGTATGFFLKQQDRWFLVTNWHVLSGRNPATGQPNHISAAVPDICRFYVSSLHDSSIFWTQHDVPLGDVANGNTHWLQHPQLGQNADVAALPLPNIDIPLARDLLAPDGNDEDMFIDLGGELFLPGFPLGFSANGLMPIWKRASLASSLEFGHSIDRFFYVDTATREGMSGTPCLAISNWRHYALDRTTNKMSVVDRPLSWRFLGVYSGRHNPSDSFEAQIGIVWRETLVLETIVGGVVATVDIGDTLGTKSTTA